MENKVTICKKCGGSWTAPNEIPNLTICPFCGQPVTVKRKKSLDTLSGVLSEIIDLKGIDVLDKEAVVMSVFLDLAPKLTFEKRQLSFLYESDAIQLMIEANIKKSDRDRLLSVAKKRLEKRIGLAEKTIDELLHAVSVALGWTVDTEEEELDIDKSETIQVNHFDTSDVNAKRAIIQIEDHYKKAMAEVKLGDLYYYGTGGERSYDESFKWYQKAAFSHLKEGEEALGKMYYYGFGCTRNYSEALKWYQKAAEQGSDSAQLKLAKLYYQGKGCEKDMNKAIYWAQVSANNGNENASKEIQTWNHTKTPGLKLY